MNTLEKFYHYFGYIKIVGLIISGVTIVLMMLAIVADVFSRNFTGGSILGVYEITQNYLMVYTVVPALPYLYGTAIMPRMDLLLKKFNKKTNYFNTLLLLIIEFVLYLIIAYYSFLFAQNSFVTSAGFMGGGKIYPLFPVHIVIPIAFLLLAIENLFTIINTIKTKSTRLTFKQHREEYF